MRRNLSELEQRLILLLRRNSRMSIVDIASELGTSRLTAKKAMDSIIIINYLVPGNLFLGQAYKDIALFILTLPVQFYSGYGFYEGAYHAIKSASLS